MNPHADDNREYIFTPVLIRVDAVLKGDPTGQALLLAAIGGTVDQDSVRWEVDDTPLFQQGAHVVLFLNKPGPVDRISVLNNQPLWHLTTRYTMTAAGLATNTYKQVPVRQLVDEIRTAARP